MSLENLSDEELELLIQQKSESIQNKGPSSIEDLTDEQLADIFKMKAEQAVSGPESSLRGVAQGVSLGFADEIAGAVESAFTDKSYEQARDESRANFEVAKAANPNAFLAGEVVGGIGSAIASGGAGVGLKGAMGMGAIAGMGYTEEDQVENQLLDSLVGVGLGAAGEGVGKFIKFGGSRLKKSIVDGLDNESDSLAMRAIGVFHKQSRKKLARKLDAKGMSSSEFLDMFENEVDTAGEKLLKGFKSQEELLDSVVDRKSQLGDEMGGVLKSIDNELGRPSIKPAELADQLSEEIIEPLINSNTATEDMIQLAGQVQKRIDVLREKKTDWTMMDLHNWKVNTQKKVNFLKKQNTDLELNAQLRRLVGSTNDFIHNKVDVLSNDPAALSTFKDLKKRFGVLADAEEFIEDSVMAESEGLFGKVRKALGLAQVGGGATVAGGIVGGVPGAAIGAALTVASKSPKVNLVMAKSLKKVGLALSKDPGNKEYMAILMGAAARSHTAFEEAIQLVERKIDGFITSEAEAAQYRIEVLNSGLPSRAQMEMMNQINAGRIPQPPQQRQPFYRKFQARDRNDNGRKI